MLDLVLEEKLDTLDPFHRLHMGDDADTDPGLTELSRTPNRNQTIALSFPTPLDVDTLRPVAITLVVDASPGCGGIAWPAGEVLSNYIARRGMLEGKTVVELGSGTGLVGLVAGFLGARVWITDQAPLLDIMKQNVALNDLGADVVVAELNWGEPIPTNIPKPDLVLAADCVYLEATFPLLVKTLADLATDKAIEVLLCYKKRRKADKRFFAQLRKEFTWEIVTDDPQREVYSREAISLLRLFRK